MGTNFYLHKPDSNRCEHCGRSDGDQVLHIGKSSAGWCFSLHVMPEEGINDLPDWERLFPTGVIRDEYGEQLSAEAMRRFITERGSPKKWTEHRWSGTFMPYRDESDFHARNESQRGPNNLLRHQLGRRCIKHGEGTWDCIVGEFS